MFKKLNNQSQYKKDIKLQHLSQLDSNLSVKLIKSILFLPVTLQQQTTNQSITMKHIIITRLAPRRMSFIIQGYSPWESNHINQEMCHYQV